MDESKLSDLDHFDATRATIDEVLADKARRLPDKVFLESLVDGQKLTYAELDVMTRRIGNALLAAGLVQGEHVGVLMENCPEQLLATWAICRAGMVAVPINTGAKGQMLTHFLGHADCVALVVERQFLGRVVAVQASLPKLRMVFVKDDETVAAAGDGASAAQGQARFTVRAFDELLEGPAEATWAPPAFNDLALLMYTSGTTGPSKANMFCQAQLIYYGLDVAAYHEYVPGDIAYVYLPMFHGNAFLGSTMGCFMADASIALARRFSVTRFWPDVQRSRATVFNCLSSIVNFLWNAAPSEQDRRHRVNRVHLAPVPGFAREFESRFGVTIMSAYGLTDFGLCTYFNTKSPREKLGSVGLPRRHVELRIFNELDQPVPPGTPGEIVLRHKLPWCSTLGYYKAEQATLASRRNLWFHTGDRGLIDADGTVWFTDRVKDAIRRRGENISAYEVEEVIRSHPAIADVAVYPVKAESSEDEVAATLILKPGSDLEPEEVLRHCNDNLAYFMVPRYVQFVAEMPRTESQKIEKHKLRASAEENIEMLWDRERAGIMVTRDGVSVRPA